MHYTAGASMESSVSTLSIGPAKASAHFVVGRDGKIAQIGDTDDILWHAGVSEWKEYKGLNRYSIGIELDNPGLLTRRGDKYTSWFGHVYPKSDVIPVKPNTGYIPYAPEQLDAAIKLAEWLIEQYPSIQEVVGHEDIAPNRKIDPGNGYIFHDKIYEHLNALAAGNSAYASQVQAPNEYASSRWAKVNVGTKLNVRSGPGTNYPVVATYRNGFSVRVRGTQGLWVKTNHGWVYGKYLTYY